MVKYSEEEKKSIEYLKENINYFKDQMKFIEATDCDYYDEEYEIYKNRIKQFEIILNLIEKQQKEIEEQKNRNKKLNTLILDLNKALEDSISKEVVIEKIQEVKEEFDRVNTSDNNDWYIANEMYGYAEEKLRELLGE